jgi:hypothetical protein
VAMEVTIEYRPHMTVTQTGSQTPVRRVRRSSARVKQIRARIVASVVASALAVFAARAASAQTPAVVPPGAPDTDIFVAPLIRRGGTVTLGPAANVTRRPGYDNQPAFDRTGRYLYYTRRAPNLLAPDSVRDVQTDIWRYDLRSQTHAAVTTTAESEYSAAVTPDGRHVTVIRVEKDSAQHLWNMPLARGAVASRLVGSVKPVGYFAWVGSRVAMFVLGSPASLQVVDTVSGRRDTIATDIGRGVRRIPGTGHVSFVQKAGSTWSIHALDPETRQVTRLVTTLPMVDDHAWLDARTLIAGSGTTLHLWHRGDSTWTQIADLASVGLRTITRVAVDPTGRRVAFVAVPATGAAAGVLRPARAP